MPDFSLALIPTKVSMVPEVPTKRGISPGCKWENNSSTTRSNVPRI